jgi:hypothetical protein
MIFFAKHTQVEEQDSKNNNKKGRKKQYLATHSYVGFFKGAKLDKQMEL